MRKHTIASEPGDSVQPNHQSSIIIVKKIHMVRDLETDKVVIWPKDIFEKCHELRNAVDIFSARFHGVC